MNRFSAHSSWIIKQNQNWFPMKALYAVLKARHKDRPAGHWVTFHTTISGVELIAMAYAWSQRGISYILSTCGSTAPAEKMYLSYFEDDYGNVSSKEISRPELAHLLYDYLPLIDEHNKQRQRILGLEKRWPTRNCWFRLLTTLLGMSIVDMHRLYLTPMGETEYIQTTFCCSDCKMPLCKKDRSNPEIGRHKSCIDEHIMSTCDTVGCHGNDRHYSNFPKDKQVQLVAHRITRNMCVGRQARV